MKFVCGQAVVGEVAADGLNDSLLGAVDRLLAEIDVGQPDMGSVVEGVGGPVTRLESRAEFAIRR